MISDVFHDAIRGTRAYLDEPAYNRVYTGRMRQRIERLVAEMEAIQRELDTPSSSIPTYIGD